MLFLYEWGVKTKIQIIIFTYKLKFYLSYLIDCYYFFSIKSISLHNKSKNSIQSFFYSSSYAGIFLNN